MVLACDFGVVILNLAKLEIQESWLSIGTNGTSVKANDAAVINDSIFIATDKGILASKFGTQNLMDYKSWKKITIADSLANKSVFKLAVSNSSLVVAFHNIGVFKKDIGWDKVIPATQALTALTAGNDKIVAFVNNQCNTYKNNENTVSYINNVTSARAAMIDAQNTDNYWIADANNGLADGNGNKFTPDGPYNNQVFNLKYIKGYLFQFAGGYDTHATPVLTNGTYSYFKEGEWFLNPQAQNQGILDLTNVTLDESVGKFYFASTWNGLIEKNDDNFKAYNAQTTPTCPIVEVYGNRVTDVYYDANTNTNWFCNITVKTAPSINKFKDGACTGYIFPFENSYYPAQIIPDNAGNMWVRMHAVKGGVMVFNDSKLNSGTPLYQYLVKGGGSGNLTDNTVRCMVKDRDGDIWLGTNNGVSVFYNPSSLIYSGVSDASYPIFENRPLMFDQVVTCIDIDGGNRKWIGTSNGGIYLFSPDGLRVIHYFNTANSPLLSNNIVSVSVQQATGEVFIGTDKGTVSYREAATTGNDESPSVLIFPNPVKTNYTGMVGFSGLATDAVVKITDINGRLLYETKANGGTAQWNVKDYNGKKVEPGVYVVLTSKDDGSAPATNKIFILD